MSAPHTTLTPAPLPDICRNRHGGNENSELANLSIHSRKQIDRARILSYAEVMGNFGITVKEVIKALDLKHQTASARMSELKAEKDLVPKCDPNIRRDGCGVFVRAKGQLSLLVLGER